MDNTQISIQKMEIAARNVDKAIAIDISAPSLLGLMNVSPQVPATASGLTDHDYPVLTGMPHALNNMPQIKLNRKVPLPSEILEHFNHVQCNIMMGLFPEINRAWLTIDSDIYVWTYEENADLAYFDGLNDTILCVGLVKPKPNVFLSHIKHLLVLTTAVDIIVLGVTFTPGTSGIMDEIQLIPEPVFTIPTDGSTFSTIIGTKSGRLFLGSKDGCLYEIVYQAEGGWFGKRCKKINWSTSILSYLVPSFLNAALGDEDGVVQIVVDDSRNILYVLTEKGSIEVYDLGEKGDGLSKVTKVSQNSLVNQAVNIVKTLDSQNFRPIVSISPIEQAESNHLYLVATTQTGARLYFTTHSLQNCPPNQRPYTLSMVHVRLPPGYSANVTVRPRAVHMANYSDRNLILLSTINDKDMLWCISGDLFPFSQNLMEAYTVLHLDAPSLALAEVKQTNCLQNLGLEGLPMLARQHCEKQKKYIVLTSEAVYIFLKQKPMDILKDLLMDCKGSDSEYVKAFFMILKEDQACATALIIASLENDQNIDLADYATRAFFLYGGEPKLLPSNMNQTNIFSGSTMFAPNIVSTPAPHNFQQQSLQQSFTPPTAPMYQSNFDLGSPFIFSAKHNGLYLYLGRILRPVWDRKCVESIIVEQKKSINTSTITSDHCRWILKYLGALHDFLQNNTQLSLGDQSNQTVQHITNPNTTLNMSVTRLNHTIQDAQIEERISLQALKIFVSYCCQIIGLWRILCEHQFYVLMSFLPEQQQQILQSTTFKDLFLYGQDICSVLIGVLVDSYLKDNASVDSISCKLREVCPNLYKIEDAAFSKANEILKSTRTILNNDEKQDLVQSALSLCKSIAPNINLQEICKQFVSLKAYNAVLDLCITSAKKVDPDNIAEHYYKNDSNIADQEGRNFYLRRMTIYKEIFNMLDQLYNEPLNICHDLQQQQSRNESHQLVFNIIDEILGYNDEVLHVALYDWMMSKNMISELIKIRNPSLESFLVHSSQQKTDNITILDLLWKYYENNGNHAAAAKILDNLANKTGNCLTLKQRMEYLTRAIMCMRSEKIGYVPYLGVFLRDLEDKMEVAKVQEQILEAVMCLRGTHPSADEAINALNSGLFSISQLYENFAEPLELWECKLAIIDTAGYTDENLVEQIWRNILKNELKNSTGNGNNRMGQILNKVKLIVRQRGCSTHCIPLDYLVNELEQLATYLKADVSMVPNALVEMGFNYSLLIDVYNKLVTSMSEIQVWQKEENEFHLFDAITALINSFIENHDQFNNVQKRKIISQCQDTVASVLSILYSKTNTERMINELRAIQSRLSRL